MRLDKGRFHHRIFRVMQELDSRCTNGQTWMTPRHEQQLNELKPFNNEELDSLFRDVLKRQNSKSSLYGILKNLVTIFFITEEKAREMRSIKILKTPVFFEVWKFVTQSNLSTEADKQKFRDTLRKCFKKRKRIRHKKIVSTLKTEETVDGMKKLIVRNRKPFNKNGCKWFTFLHGKKFFKLVVFGDEELDKCLREVLKLPSSTASKTGIGVNLINLLWKQEDIRYLSPIIVFENKVFHKIWSFVLHGHSKPSIMKDRKSIASILKKMRQCSKNSSTIV